MAVSAQSLLAPIDELLVAKAMGIAPVDVRAM